MKKKEKYDKINLTLATFCISPAKKPLSVRYSPGLIQICDTHINAITGCSTINCSTSHFNHFSHGPWFPRTRDSIRTYSPVCFHLQLSTLSDNLSHPLLPQSLWPSQHKQLTSSVNLLLSVFLLFLLQTIDTSIYVQTYSINNDSSSPEPIAI